MVNWELVITEIRGCGKCTHTPAVTRMRRPRLGHVLTRRRLAELCSLSIVKPVYSVVSQAVTLCLKKHEGKGSGDTAIIPNQFFTKPVFYPSRCRGKFKCHEYLVARPALRMDLLEPPRPAIHGIALELLPWS